MRTRGWIVGMVVLVAMVAGCGPRAMLKDAKQRAALVQALAADSVSADSLYAALIAGDATRHTLVARVMANGQARQELMFAAARDRALIEGMINLAVQDTTMRDHVFTLVRGMEMMLRR